MFQNNSYPKFMFRQATEPSGVSQGALWFNTDNLVLSVYNGTSWEAMGSSGLPPIGSVIAWLKSLTGTPAIPTGWVECNGQVLDDEESLYDGVTIPNLNSGGVEETYSYFLRGHTSSGITGTSQNKSHTHTIEFANSNTAGSNSVYASSLKNSGNTSVTHTTLSSGGIESTPMFYTVVWIMRIK